MHPTDAVLAAERLRAVQPYIQAGSDDMEDAIARDILQVARAVTEMAARIERLEAAVTGLLETGPDEPLMDDPSPQGRSRYSFWFCGGTIRKGHGSDCPWQALLAATTAPAARGEREGS